MTIYNGTNKNDILYGESGDDILDGGYGADILIGGEGNDTYYVDNINDVVKEYSGQGNDKIFSSVSYSLLGSNVETLELTRKADLNATGNSLNNTLIGSIGNNILDGGYGADILIGGEGNDTYYVDNINDVVKEYSGQGNDKIFSSVSYSLLGSNVETLELTRKADLNATGNSLNNTLIGSIGNNILDGGYGADILIGGEGNDTYYVDNINDVVKEYNGQGNDKIFSSVSYSLLGSNVETLELTGSGNIHAIGNSLDNILIGNKGSNILDGGMGNDIYIFDSNDIVVENYYAGLDTIISDINYILNINFEILKLIGNSDINGVGNDSDNTLKGNVGDNILDGKAGNDVLDGGLGADTLIGGKGGDIYYVDNLNDMVIEVDSSGSVYLFDKIYSSVNYNLPDFVENIELIGSDNINANGNTLNNTIIGNGGNNILNGGAGLDTLDDTNGGLDTLIGGLDNDTYIINSIDTLVLEQTNEGTDIVKSSVDYILGDNVENLILTGDSNINGVGNLVNNILNGNKAANIINGQAGNDILDGGVGVDTLIGGEGDDIFYVDNANDKVVEIAGQGNDKIFATADYTLAENVFVETVVVPNTVGVAVDITGNSLDNILIGNSSNNTLKGGAGNDTLIAAYDGSPRGADILIGGIGDDLYMINRYDTVIELAGDGVDTVKSYIGYTLTSNVENLTLLDYVYPSPNDTNSNGTGNYLDNIIIGNSYKNILNGHAGNDTITGANGSDTAMYQLLNSNSATGGNGSDTWTDFTVGDITSNTNADKIDVSALLVDYSGDNTISALEPYLTINNSGGNTTVLIDRDGAGSTYSDTLLLTLNGVATNLATLLDNHQIVV
jgi:Ca2+-binding RTX toxin-like protein